MVTITSGVDHHVVSIIVGDKSARWEFNADQNYELWQSLVLNFPDLDIEEMRTLAKECRAAGYDDILQGYLRETTIRDRSRALHEYLQSESQHA